MTRQQTKKNYSLRKLKTGTASVAVALTVLGAGFANQTTVKAEGVRTSGTIANSENISKLYDENSKLVEERAELLDKIDKLEELAKEKEKKAEDKAEDVERHYLRKLDQEHKEQEERQKNLEELERQGKREIDKRYQEQLQKQQQLETEKQKLTEANQVSEASRKGLSNDLEASRAAKKELEAKHQKLEA
ncbi:YSIRK-type signal peptide-containing protein, partial [Streptococcus pyogenes]